MKKKFSTKWKASKQPRKQRKYVANAPLHTKKKFVNINLSKELREKMGKRNILVKKGDKVKIVRGKFKGKQGKVLEVSVKYSKVIVEGIQATKMDNSKVNIKLQPSNLQIIELAERKRKNTEEKKKETPKNSKTAKTEENKK